MLVTIDRWFSSSIDVRWRHIISKKNSLQGIVIITGGSILMHYQLLYCYEANLIGTPLKCFTRNIECRLINALAFAIIAILYPLTLIAIFGWMTILNTWKTRVRIEPMATIPINRPPKLNTHQRRSKKTNQRLLLMLFVQVIFLALFTLPLAIQKLYTTLTMSIQKSALQITIEDFIYQIALISTYFAAGMPFYINTLGGGSVFKKAMTTLTKLMLGKILCR